MNAPTPEEAREALDKLVVYANNGWGSACPGEVDTLRRFIDAHSAPVQPEPVAWRLRNTSFRQPHFEFYATEKQAKDRQEAFNMSVDDGGLYDLTPLYASPPPAQPAPANENDWTEVDLWAEIHRAP